MNLLLRGAARDDRAGARGARAAGRAAERRAASGGARRRARARRAYGGIALRWRAGSRSVRACFRSFPLLRAAQNTIRETVVCIS